MNVTKEIGKGGGKKNVCSRCQKGLKNFKFIMWKEDETHGSKTGTDWGNILVCI